jgi:hypothetical protein
VGRAAFDSVAVYEDRSSSSCNCTVSSCRVGTRRYPTATQPLAEVQDTPYKFADVAPAGAGAFWTDQPAPSQTSARGAPRLALS